MAYDLILTGEERDAFDWVGDRYNNGDAMADILRDCIVPDPNNDEDFDYWNEPGDVTFNVPEHKAWEIKELAEENTEGGHSMWPCFAEDLRDKMYEFIDSIV